METVETYLTRKSEELDLLNGFLANPLTIRHPRSVAEVIEQKFHLAAALKAEHQLHDWATTETAWTHSFRPCSGPFEFRYDYQRADLEVRGAVLLFIGKWGAQRNGFTRLREWQRFLPCLWLRRRFFPKQIFSSDVILMERLLS